MGRCMYHSHWLGVLDLYQIIVETSVVHIIISLTVILLSDRLLLLLLGPESEATRGHTIEGGRVDRLLNLQVVVSLVELSVGVLLLLGMPCCLLNCQVLSFITCVNF